MKRLSGSLLALLTLAACSTPPPKAPEPEAPPPPPTRPHASGMGVSAELGQIDEAATTKTFERVRPAMMACYAKGLERLDVLAGDLKFYLRIKADGHVRWLFLEQTTLGDRVTEKCMLDVLNGAQWPLPEGGEAEVHQGMGFDAPPGVRPPTTWSPDKVAAAFGKRAKDVAACKAGDDAAFHVTAYVEQKGSGGHVLTAGSNAPSAAAAAKLDCLLGVVNDLKVPSPGSYPAKVELTL